MLAGMLAVVPVRPAAAEVSSLSGSAFGYYTNVGLFGGPRTLKGHGTTVSSTDISYSPSVTLPAEGSTTPVTASDADGAKAQYGPAVLFGGRWSDDVASPPPSGPMSVSTQGTPAGGSVTSSAHVVLDSHPEHETLNDGPGGIGPGPLVADEARSTCTADESGVSGSSSFVNGTIELKYDKNTQLPIVTEDIPANPPPNYTRSGTLDHVGDSFTLVLNEQIIGPDSITVNAAHMYLLGNVARGDMVIGSSTCSLSSSVPNATPVANDDALTTDEDTPLTTSASALLGNDTDPDGNPLSATNAQAVFVPGPLEPSRSLGTTYTFPSDPPHGTATINGDGSLAYTPDPDFFGTDTFTYVARDARGANDPATVSITVTPVPDTPVAVDDFEQTIEETPLTVPAPGVLGNDTDGDGDALTAGEASDPANGSVTLNADGSYTYTPDTNFLGTDTFTYTVSDGTGRSDTGVVSIFVHYDEASVLKDIGPGDFGSSNPGSFTQLGDAVYFRTDASSSQMTGLWKTDGTEAGTVLIKNVRASGLISVVGSTLFFQAHDGTGFNQGANGIELWKSDGTEAGTVLVKDIRPGTGSSSPIALKVVGNSLYFSADNGTTGRELWKTDGTEAGTVLVKDINPGTAASSPTALVAVGETVFFSASNGTTTGSNGRELWKTDGTEAGTVRVKDINPGTASSNPSGLQALGDTVYFSALTSTNGIELWKTDGTEAGTVQVKDINPGTASSRADSLTAFGSTLLFKADNGLDGAELWKSDGTEAGTVQVKNINPGQANSSPSFLIQFGDVVLFSAASAGASAQLWKSDGTEAGTVEVKEINPSGSARAHGFSIVGDIAYFSADDGTHGVELWRTDTTMAGTHMAEDLNPRAGSSSPSQLAPALGTMFFSASVGTTGTEPWRLNPPKQAPVAVDDFFAATEDTPLVVEAPGVLANDTDANGDALSAGSASDPANGSVTLNADGSFTYTPDPDFNGTDSFTYEADDGDLGTDTALVTITVAPVNDAPVAGDDAYATAHHTPVSVDAPGVLANDGDVDGDTLTAGSPSAPARGTVTLNADGSFTYTPEPGFMGTDTFTYVVSDAQGGSDVATVTMTVARPGPPPRPDRPQR